MRSHIRCGYTAGGAHTSGGIPRLLGSRGGVGSHVSGVVHWVGFRLEQVTRQVRSHSGVRSRVDHVARVVEPLIGVEGPAEEWARTSGAPQSGKAL